MLIALWIILIVCLLWLALTELPAGWDGHKPLPYLIALTPMLWIAFAALGVAGLCMREWGFAACCAAGLIASLMRKTAYWLNDLKSPNTGEAIARKIAERKAREAQSHTQATQGTPRLDDAHDGRFRVLTFNCRFGHANAAEIVRTVRDEDVAVLALQELTEDLVRQLDAAGLAELLPYRQLGDPQASDNGGFNGVWLRVEPTQSTPTGVAIPAADVPAVTLQVSPMRDITFASAHPKSPQRGCREWSEGIIGLGALAHPQQNLAAPDAPAHETITVILGDLNSSIPHPSFRKLLASGFHDAALDEAKGLHPTYPTWLPWPRIVIDHVIFTDHLHASDVQAVHIDGSDHMALAATLTLQDKHEPVNAAARETWPESLPPLPKKKAREQAQR